MGTLQDMAADPGFTHLERRMTQLADQGVDEEEIARRFRRSPAFVQRVMALAKVPRRGDGSRPSGLRPVERRVLKWRDRGVSVGDIAQLFRRQPRTIEQIERLARYKQGK
jgi:DNA-binding CsgD family transcriptional regulator